MTGVTVFEQQAAATIAKSGSVVSEVSGRVLPRNPRWPVVGSGGHRRRPWPSRVLAEGDRMQDAPDPNENTEAAEDE
jgi:hypothetical protein